MESEQSVGEIVDLVHSLFIQSRPVSSAPVDETPTSSIGTKSVPSSPSANISRSQSFPVRKKIQVKSAPLKPPDIGNVSLFPSVEESVAFSPSPKRVPLKSAIPNNNSVNNDGVWDARGNNYNKSNNKNLSSLEEEKMKTLEAKLTAPLGNQVDRKNVTVTTPVVGRRASLQELPSTPTSRKTPRSAKLFSELSSDRRVKLDELAENYSKAIDFNKCRNILDELEFVFQLLNTSSLGIKVVQPNLVEAGQPLLISVAEHAYFAIKIVINQLDKICLSLPINLIQLIVENYPHKIPKPVRKHMEDWIAVKKTEIEKKCIISDEVPVDLCKTVTFKSEKDGRANFPHQTDFHGFCKQRDMFYLIRDNWTSADSSCSIIGATNNSSGIITDRSKARMSFPPVQSSSASGTSSRYIDSLPFKVQSLFLINSKPTNLFHMASLFVSHYLIEARQQEVGGIPQDNNMKEFFQSNPNKLAQLNSRFSTPSSETLDTDQSSNLAFQKDFLLASSPKFVQHVIDRLVIELIQTENRLECDDLSNPSQICRLIKDSVHLARLLGFALFLPYSQQDLKTNDNQGAGSIEKESIIHEQVSIRNYQRPPIDLNFYLEKAFRMGRLTATCPWVLEYLLQCDSISLQLAAYQTVIVTLFSLYRNILTINSSSNLEYKISNNNKNFLRFYIGTLFSSKTFPDSTFSFLKSQELMTLSNVDSISNAQEGVVDSLEQVTHSLTDFFFHDTFNRLKRILSWGRLEVCHPAMTGDIRHIRPIPATDKSPASFQTQLSREKVIQSQLEATFFELYPTTLKRSVDFVSERMSTTYISLAKTQLFPNFRSMLAHQGIFGVRAAEKCRIKISEEMSKYFSEKCYLAVKLFLEQSTTPGVLRICQNVATRKASEVGKEWIKNYITPAMFPDVGSGSEGEGSINSPNKKASILSLQSALSTAQSPKPSTTTEDVPFEILILIHRMIRRMQSSGRDSLDPQLIDKVLTCQNFGKATWIFNSLVEWGICLITYQPKLLTPTRIKELTNLWKLLWNPGAKVINSRNLMILTKSTDQRDSWIKLGTVTQHLINDGIIKPEDLEQQCLELLREEWPDQTHKRISGFLTLVLETFREKLEWHSESAQVLDWVAWLCSGQSDQE